MLIRIYATSDRGRLRNPQVRLPRLGSGSLCGCGLASANPEDRVGQELAGVSRREAEVRSFARGDRGSASTVLAWAWMPNTSACVNNPKAVRWQRCRPIELRRGCRRSVWGTRGVAVPAQSHIQAGQKPPVNGAGGSFGTFACSLPVFGVEVTAWTPWQSWTCPYRRGPCRRRHPAGFRRERRHL